MWNPQETHYISIRKRKDSEIPCLSVSGPHLLLWTYFRTTANSLRLKPWEWMQLIPLCKSENPSSKCMPQQNMAYWRSITHRERKSANRKSWYGHFSEVTSVTPRTLRIYTEKSSTYNRLAHLFTRRKLLVWETMICRCTRCQTSWFYRPWDSPGTEVRLNPKYTNRKLLDCFRQMPHVNLTVYQ